MDCSFKVVFFCNNIHSCSKDWRLGSIFFSFFFFWSVIFFFLFLNKINTFVQQGCVKLIKSDIKDFLLLLLEKIYIK